MTDVAVPARTLHVVLVEDQPELAAALRDLLEADGAIEVVAVCHTLSIASEVIARVQPAIVVTDFRLPDGDSVDDFGLWHASSPRTRIVVVSAWTDVRSIRRARLGGASAYLEKGVRLTELPETLLRVGDGHRWWPGQWPDIQHGAQAPADGPTTHSDAANDEAGEADVAGVLDGVRRGCTTAQIAVSTHIAEREVRAHVNTLLRRFGVTSRSELRRVAESLGDR